MIICTEISLQKVFENNKPEMIKHENLYLVFLTGLKLLFEYSLAEQSPRKISNFLAKMMNVW